MDSGVDSEKEDLEKQVASLRQTLQQRENEVKKAGMFGKELLQHNTVLLAQVDELKAGDSLGGCVQ